MPIKMLAFPKCWMPPSKHSDATTIAYLEEIVVVASLRRLYLHVSNSATNGPMLTIALADV